jgi:hypothetical protein
LPALLNSVSSQQAFLLCSILSAFACAAAAVRLFFLPSLGEYRLFIGLFAAWALPSLVPLAVPVSSRAYFLIYVYLSPVSWLLYIFVSRDIYQKIFRKYQGIAFAGRTCLHVSVVCLFVSIIAGMFFSNSSVRGSTFSHFTSIDRSVLFGLSFFLLLVVATIVRYPIPITRNFIVHCIFFSATLLLQSIFSVVDQATGYHYSMFCNTLTAALSTLLITGWALVLTKAGDIEAVRIRQNIRPEVAVHLLGQLDSLNSILLRAARK